MSTLTAGHSTIADAATFYDVPVQRIYTVLAGALTDVYTPDGDGVVIASYGHKYARTTPCDWYPGWIAAELTLASDSIRVLAAEHRGDRESFAGQRQL
jgi:hypothetical protein